MVEMIDSQELDRKIEEMISAISEKFGQDGFRSLNEIILAEKEREITEEEFAYFIESYALIAQTYGLLKVYSSLHLPQPLWAVQDAKESEEHLQAYRQRIAGIMKKKNNDYARMKEYSELLARKLGEAPREAERKNSELKKKVNEYAKFLDDLYRAETSGIRLLFSEESRKAYLRAQEKFHRIFYEYFG